MEYVDEQNAEWGKDEMHALIFGVSRRGSASAAHAVLATEFRSPLELLG